MQLPLISSILEIKAYMIYFNKVFFNVVKYKYKFYRMGYNDVKKPKLYYCQRSIYSFKILHIIFKTVTFFNYQNMIAKCSIPGCNQKKIVITLILLTIIYIVRYNLI